MSISDTLSAQPDAPARAGPAKRVLALTSTLLSLGTNKLLARGSGWLTRKGLARYVLPTLLLNEALGAYRAYVAGGAAGLW